MTPTCAMHAAVWALLLESTHPNLATDVIYVAGDRVVSDPLCKPFSMGRCWHLSPAAHPAVIPSAAWRDCMRARHCYHSFLTTCRSGNACCRGDSATAASG